MCISARGRYWLSGTDLPQDSCWIWAAPVISQIESSILSTFWATGQPSNTAKEDCMTLFDDGGALKFDNENCNKKIMFICKRPIINAYTSHPTFDEIMNSTLC